MDRRQHRQNLCCREQPAVSPPTPLHLCVGQKWERSTRFALVATTRTSPHARNYTHVTAALRPDTGCKRPSALTPFAKVPGGRSRADQSRGGLGGLAASCPYPEYAEPWGPSRQHHHPPRPACGPWIGDEQRSVSTRPCPCGSHLHCLSWELTSRARVTSNARCQCHGFCVCYEQAGGLLLYRGARGLGVRRARLAARSLLRRSWPRGGRRGV